MNRLRSLGSLLSSLLVVMGLATACGSGGGSATGAGGGGGSSLVCPSHDEARLFVDGTEVLPLQVIGGGGTGTPPTEASPNEASLILSKMLMGGGEDEAFVYLRALVVGSGVSLAQSSAEYRVYPPSDGGSPPTTDVIYAGAQLTGTLNVIRVAVKPGDSICGTFDLTGQGTPSVRITGGFHHVWKGPQPGGG